MTNQVLGLGLVGHSLGLGLVGRVLDFITDDDSRMSDHLTAARDNGADMEL